MRRYRRSEQCRDGWSSEPRLARELRRLHARSVVVEALEHNTDLRIAAARVEQARGYAKAAGASIYPSVTLLARGGSNLSGDDSGLQGLLLSASWELDLWGRVRSERAAGKAQYASAELDGEYARQSLVALVAKSWFLATEARLQKGIAEDMVRASEQLVDVARQRQQVGVGDEYDLAVAEANLGGVRDTLRQLELGYLQSQRALEVLLGRYPSASLAAADALPGLPPPCRPACPLSCSSAGRTWSRPSGAWPRPSTAEAEAKAARCRK